MEHDSSAMGGIPLQNISVVHSELGEEDTTDIKLDPKITSPTATAEGGDLAEDAAEGGQT